MSNYITYYDLFSGYLKNISSITGYSAVGKSIFRSQNSQYYYHTYYYSEPRRFVYDIISEKERQELFKIILSDSYKSLDLLLAIDREFINNDRKNIVSHVEKYSIISSICYDPKAAYTYLCEEDNCANYLERIRLIESIASSEEQINNLLNFSLVSTLKSLDEKEIDIILNKILELNNWQLAVNLYKEKNIVLSEQQKEKLAPLIVAMQLAKTY